MKGIPMQRRSPLRPTVRSSPASPAVAHAETLAAKAAGALRRWNGPHLRGARNVMGAWRIVRERDTLGVSVMTWPVVSALTREIAGAKSRGIATHSGPTLVEGVETAIVRIRIVPSAPFRSFGRRPIEHEGQCFAAIATRVRISRPHHPALNTAATCKVP